MALDLFDRSIEPVLAMEGDLFDHPQDPGGITFRGVSIRAVVGLKDKNGHLEFDIDGDGDVDKNDFYELEKLWKKGNTTKVTEFYRKHYWLAAKCDAIRWPFCYLLLDASVHHGVKAGVVLMQKALGVHDDGVMGPQTIKAANNKPQMETLKRYLVKRSRLMHDICVRRGPVFYEGWMRRLFDVHSEAMRRI